MKCGRGRWSSPSFPVCTGKQTSQIMNLVSQLIIVHHRRVNTDLLEQQTISCLAEMKLYNSSYFILFSIISLSGGELRPRQTAQDQQRIIQTLQDQVPRLGVQVQLQQRLRDVWSPPGPLRWQGVGHLQTAHLSHHWLLQDQHDEH